MTLAIAPLLLLFAAEGRHRSARVRHAAWQPEGQEDPRVAFEAARSVCGDGYVDVAGGETSDAGGGDSEPTLATLEAAHEALAAGATDVALSADGTLRFRRTATAAGGIDEIVRGAAVLVRWVYGIFSRASAQATAPRLGP